MPIQHVTILYTKNIDWLRFNGTFSTFQHFRAFDQYVAVLKSESNDEVDNVTGWEYIQ